MQGGNPSEFIAVMDNRGDVLGAFSNGPTDKRDLERALDLSRSTIDRAVRELEDVGMVERVDGGYRRTLPGELALAEYDRFRERVAGLCEGASLLSAVEPGADVDPAFLAGARSVEATRPSPQRPIEVLYEVVGRATQVRGFSPAVHPQQVETYRERVIDAGMAAEIVVTEAALERLLTDYAEAVEEAMDLDHVAFYETDGEMPYSLTVAETPDGPHAGMLVYGEGGILGCILNDAPAAVEWAAERFERERERATRVA